MASTERARQLETEIARLGDLDRAKLIDLWTKAYGRKPFKGASRKLLIRSAVYMLQKRAYGALKRSTHLQLLQIARDDEVQQPPASNERLLQPGMRLIREWHGTSHTVDVTDDGFVWNDETYSSLTAIAKAITGAHWSGPRFFQI